MADDHRLADLYPEGRTIYGEDDDQSSFLAACQNIGLEPQVIVHVPSNKLARFYRVVEAHGFRYGT